MSDHMPTPEDAVRQAVHAINDAWRAGRYGDLGALIDEDAVIAPPESEGRVRGREAYVGSYRDYDQVATTHEFSPGEPQVDVIGDVAVAVCPFAVAYELDGEMYRERGQDTLVFARRDGEWRVVWRTMRSEPST